MAPSRPVPDRKDPVSALPRQSRSSRESSTNSPPTRTTQLGHGGHNSLDPRLLWYSLPTMMKEVRPSIALHCITAIQLPRLAQTPQDPHLITSLPSPLLRSSPQIFSLQNLRTAPGSQGQLGRFSQDVAGTPVPVYLDSNGSECAWPTNMSVLVSPPLSCCGPNTERTGPEKRKVLMMVLPASLSRPTYLPINPIERITASNTHSTKSLPEEKRAAQSGGEFHDTNNKQTPSSLNSAASMQLSS